jgi:hypothetical protein
MTTPGKQHLLLWLVPIVFLLHNVEQAMNIRDTMEAARSGMPRLLRIIIPPVSADQYIVALVIATALAFAAALGGRIDRQRTWGVYALVALQMALFLNVIAHVMASLVLQHYTAGLATALGVLLPLSAVLFWYALREKWLPLWAFLLMIPVGAFIHGPMFFGILYFSGFLAGWLNGTL